MSQATAVNYAEDRTIRVPSGAIVKTAYVDIFKIRLGCRARMAVGDVAVAYQKELQLGDQERWPCPTGHWDGKEFVLCDGRHEYVAKLMLGKTHILVSWVEEKK